MSRAINLLPPQRRRQLARQLLQVSLVRLGHSLLLSLGTITIVGLIAVAVLWGWAAASRQPVERELDTAVAEYQELRGEIATQNHLIEKMTALHTEHIVWSDLFRDVFGALPPGTIVEIMSGDSAKRELVFRGQAPTRASLVIMEERIESLPWVAAVEAPHANLLQRENPIYTFSVSLQANPQP